MPNTGTQRNSIVFDRKKLAIISPAIKKAGFSALKYGSTTSRTNGMWEFGGPDNFIWAGKASNSYDARYKGWFAFLTMRHPAFLAEALADQGDE
jgi:hypothetical protein